MTISGARVFSAGKSYGATDIVIEGEKIVGVERSRAEAGSPQCLDATGLIALPGFVDIHSHGRGGFDFCDATDEAFSEIARGKLEDGVTSFLATGLTRPEADLAKLCECAARYCGALGDRALPHCGESSGEPVGRDRRSRREDGATCLGVHLEGPFFNPSMAGAQNPDYLKKPDIGMVDRLNQIAPIRKVSFAPELEGGIEFAAALKSRGIVASLGHSAANCDTFEAARKAGATHLTHFCNAMMPSHHLRPSMVTGGLVEDDVLAEIITDGVHLSDEMIRLIVKCKGPQGVMVITDAMCAAGKPDGIYSLGGLRVNVEKGKATLADVPYDPNAVVSNVAGSVALYPQCFKRFVAATDLPLEAAAYATGYNQLRSLGITDRGEIAVGQFADIVLLNAAYDPVMTISNGKLKWRKKQ